MEASKKVGRKPELRQSISENIIRKLLLLKCRLF